MFWGSLRLSAEDILGSVHCVLRARRQHEPRPDAWDDLYRGSLNPPHDMRDVDMPWYILSMLAYDLRPLDRGNGPL